MECERCEDLSNLANALAEVLRTDAKYAREFQKDWEKSVSQGMHGLGTAYPRPEFSGEKAHKAVAVLQNSRFFGHSGLLDGSFNNISYAEKLSNDIQSGKGAEEPHLAGQMADSLEGAANELNRFAASGLVDCLLACLK